MRYRYGNVLLCWIHPLQPAVQQPAGNFCEGLQMNEDDDSGGGFFVDFIKSLIAIFFFTLFMCVVASIVWGLIA